MADRRLDMGKAWSQATGLVRANRDLVGVLAGIFLFLPMFVLALALLGADVDFGPPGGTPDPEQISSQINAVLIANWWALLLAGLGQLCGGIAIMALIGDRNRPTVSEVLRLVPRLILPVFGAQVVVTLATQGLSILTGLLPAGAAAIGNLVAFPLSLYLTIKFCLVSPAIVIGGQRNPLAAMQVSWGLTKANALRLFGFFAMLVVVAGVIGLIVLLMAALLLSVIGQHGALIGNAAVAALLLTVFYTVSYALSVAIFRQLSGTVGEEELRTFD